MLAPRFIFLAVAAGPPPSGAVADATVLWMVVSANNRPLGRAPAGASYAGCRAAVRRLRRAAGDARATIVPTGDGGRWTWRLDLDDATVAVASRSYLRLRECQYNLARFREAVGRAEVTDGVRGAGRDRLGEPAADLR